MLFDRNVQVIHVRLMVSVVVECFAPEDDRTVTTTPGNGAPVGSTIRPPSDCAAVDVAQHSTAASVAMMTSRVPGIRSVRLQTDWLTAAFACLAEGESTSGRNAVSSPMAGRNAHSR